MRQSAPLLKARSWYLQALLVAAIAWGAFAFGAVYSWGFWPLAAAMLIVALGGLTCGGDSGFADFRWLSLTFSLLAVAILLQLVPLPVDFLARLSPRALHLVEQLDLTLSTGVATHHAISIAPTRTVTGAALFATFALLVLGSARIVSTRGPRGLAEAVTVIGVLLAFTAIIQKPLFVGKIYGFWDPQQPGVEPFGPFVNPNHFAGWMLMALPLTLSVMSAGIAHGIEGVKPVWRDRIIWLSSPAASRMVLLAAAAVVMALSLVMTMSRSGIGTLILAATTFGVVVSKRQRTRAVKTLALVLLTLIIAAVFGWVGINTMRTRFASADWSNLNGRLGAAADALAIASRFPLTGTGLNTYGVATLFYQEHDLEYHYREAHNDYLQLLAEGGAMLTIPATGCAGALLALVRRRFREDTASTSYWLRVGAVTGIAAIALQETVEFSLQMPGNAALFAVLCGVAIHQSPQHDRLRRADGEPRRSSAAHNRYSEYRQP